MKRKIDAAWAADIMRLIGPDEDDAEVQVRSVEKKQHIVFFVGPDMCGKTQIAKELARRLGDPNLYFKASSEHATFMSKVPRNEAFMNQLRYADPRVFDLLKQTQHSVVFDRGYPCEHAYSAVLNRPTDADALKHMDEAWASLGSVIVFCHRSSYVGIVDDLDPKLDATVLRRLHEAYESFLARSACRVLRLNVDDGSLDREVGEILAFMGVQ